MKRQPCSLAGATLAVVVADALKELRYSKDARAVKTRARLRAGLKYFEKRHGKADDLRAEIHRRRDEIEEARAARAALADPVERMKRVAGMAPVDMQSEANAMLRKLEEGRGK